MRLSANLGFLFTDLPLAERIHAAREAGFDAVEFHDQPQAEPVGPLVQALAVTGLPVLALNTYMGPQMGRAAMSRIEFARDLAAAEDAAARIGAGAIHVTAGLGGDRDLYRSNLAHALRSTDRVILIEPICERAMPGYHLSTLAQAEEVLADLDHPRLRLMFDWYHMATSLGPKPALDALARLAPTIGHVQLARLSDRAEPLPAGLPELPQIFAVLRAHGLTAVGLEYRPTGPVAPTVAALRAM